MVNDLHRQILRQRGVVVIEVSVTRLVLVVHYDITRFRLIHVLQSHLVDRRLNVAVGYVCNAEYYFLVNARWQKELEFELCKRFFL
jgi:hypothetical protein